MLDDIAASGFEFAQDAAGAGQECLSNFGKTHGTAKAVEKARAELVFEFENLLRKRRLRDVRLLRSAGEGACVGDGAKVAELMEFDKAVLSCQSSVLSRSTCAYDRDRIPKPRAVLLLQNCS